MDKQSLREHAKNVRKNSNSPNIGKFICENIKNTKAFEKSQNIMLYYPFGSEINLLELLDNQDKNWYLPRVEEDEIEVYLYEKGDMLSENKWQIPEPCLEDKKVDKKVVDMVVVPALCADKRGFRIGYGLGFYDRFLRNMPSGCIRLIPVMAELFLDEVPKDLWDEPANIVVTEKDIYEITSGS